MIYTIVGTSKSIREKAKKELSMLPPITRRLYTEDVDHLRPLINVSSLFGDVTVVECVQMLDDAVVRERIYDLLDDMAKSSTIFIIDEPFGDVNRATKLRKFSEKFFDAKEEKEKDGQVFTLVEHFIRRDKKQAWLSWLELRDSVDAEAMQGALWWKFLQVWQATLEGRRTAFSKEECESFGRRILLASVLAHKGEADLEEEIEKLVLSI